MSSSWITRPTDFIKQVDSDMEKLVKNITIELVYYIGVLSPIDTARFINNHKISVGAPVFDIYLNFDATGREEYQENGAETRKSLRQALPKITPYSLVYIQNNLDYAEDLEEGTSAQAPKGVYKPAFEYVLEKFK